MDRRRYRRAIEQNIDILSYVGDGTYRVNGNRGINYLVNLDQHSCTCPDWQDERPEGGCKHLIKVKLQARNRELSPSIDVNDQSENSSEPVYPKNWMHIRKQILRRDGWECQNCGSKSDSQNELHVHHITPKSRGGPDEPENLITLCRDCHEKLHGRSIPGGTFEVTPSGDINPSSQSSSISTEQEDVSPSPSISDDSGFSTSAEGIELTRSGPPEYWSLPEWSRASPEYSQWRTSSSETQTSTPGKNLTSGESDTESSGEEKCSSKSSSFDSKTRSEQIKEHIETFYENRRRSTRTSSTKSGTSSSGSKEQSEQSDGERESETSEEYERRYLERDPDYIKW